MMQQIYLGLGGASALALTVSSTTTNLDLATLFNNAQSGVWADSQDKTLIIDSGVIVGATATSNAALTIPSGMGGTLTIINNGAIQGAGGGCGCCGGDAIQVLSSGVIITNNGDIYAGGGGGGNGGTGGTGGDGSYAQTLGASTTTGNSCNNSCTQHFNSSAYCASANTSGATAIIIHGMPVTYRCSSCRQTSSSSGGSGGSGGTGGVGQGYNQSAGQAAPEVLVQAAAPMLVLVVPVELVELVVHLALVVVQAALAVLEATETSAMVQPVQPVALAVQPVTT